MNLNGQITAHGTNHIKIHLYHPLDQSITKQQILQL